MGRKDTDVALLAEVETLLREDRDFCQMVERYIKAEPSGRKVLVEIAQAAIRAGTEVDRGVRDSLRHLVQGHNHDDDD